MGYIGPERCPPLGEDLMFSVKVGRIVAIPFGTT